MSFLDPDDCPPPPALKAGLPTLILHEACQSAGGVAHLARRLGVPAERLARWLEGEESAPEAVYRACADIVLLS